MTRKKPITYNGKDYESITDAAKDNFITVPGLIYRLKQGFTNAEERRYKGKPCTWNGVNYNSIAEAARANGIKEGSMAARLRKGQVCDREVGPSPMVDRRCKPCFWNGTWYKSRAEAARQLGISPESLYYRLEQGYTCDEDMPVGAQRNGKATSMQGWERKPA